MSVKKRKARKSVNSLYLGKSTLFKIFLLAGVAVISLVFILYTFDMIETLKNDTRDQVEKYVRMWQLAANSDMSTGEYQFIFDEIIVKATFPIIVLDSERKPILSRNVKGVEPNDTTAATMERLKKEADAMVKLNGDYPLMFTNKSDTFINYFCYGDSHVVNQLKWMPFVEIGIILAFMLIAFIGFQNIRKSEERFIWVGMAKETAHQLGTPISSLMGWLEVMDAEKDSSEFSYEQKKMIDDTTLNMKIDVERLEKVANRFGKIGSVPELVTTDLNSIICDSVVYYRRRIPFEGKGVQLNFIEKEIPPVELNQELFGWAMENMIKNSLQSVDAKSGVIELKTIYNENDKWVKLEICDNGKGISAAAARKIFVAGFTTKKRGWGLGLTLVKRIIEEYHGGRISLKKSKPGETVFEILLPVSENRIES